jgi:hypothetical protein
VEDNEQGSCEVESEGIGACGGAEDVDELRE